MPIANTAHRYGSVAKTFHWLTALLILTNLALGIVAAQWPLTPESTATKVALFSVHKTTGVTIFAVALLRILWAVTQPRPGLLNADRPAEATLAETVHWLLYGALVAVPLTGWLHHSAAEGFAPILWPLGQSLPLVPKSPALAELFSGLHFAGVLVLAAAVALHATGALKHHLLDGDATLRRMWFGNAGMPEPPAGPRPRAPLPAAITVWALALAGGAMLGLSGAQAPAGGGSELAEVESEWQVRDGTLAIEITQMGSAVRGEFADWTADIAFSRTPRDGRHGEVRVEIAIRSLTLGSVTDQAMGEQYFHAEEYPKALFEADIVPAGEGAEADYVAEGTLEVKGNVVPVSLPFALEISDGVAEMTGGLTLDRRDFGIAPDTTDPGTLGFEVAVEVALTAEQAAAGGA